jgi:hypothetical protein
MISAAKPQARNASSQDTLNAHAIDRQPYKITERVIKTLKHEC